MAVKCPAMHKEVHPHNPKMSIMPRVRNPEPCLPQKGRRWGEVHHLNMPEENHENTGRIVLMTTTCGYKFAKLMENHRKTQSDKHTNVLSRVGSWKEREEQ